MGEEEEEDRPQDGLDDLSAHELAVRTLRETIELKKAVRMGNAGKHEFKRIDQNGACGVCSDKGSRLCTLVQDVQRAPVPRHRLLEPAHEWRCWQHGPEEEHGDGGRGPGGEEGDRGPCQGVGGGGGLMRSTSAQKANIATPVLRCVTLVLRFFFVTPVLRNVTLVIHFSARE